jgi:hypothetical protein
MAKIKLFFFISIITSLLFSCQIREQTSEKKELKDPSLINLNDELCISFEKGNGFNHPTFVVWLETLEGQYIKTLLVTKSYASGIFNYKMQGDTIWRNEAGESIQPAALPYWTSKIGNVPTKAKPFVDAYTAATPKSDFKYNTIKPKADAYRILVEVNQTWDWNKYWTNNKYPDSDAYKHSAQPSVIYAVNINNSDKTYYLNPIGHGDPKGETGKLFTDLSSLTSAKQIFSEIKVIIK